MNQNNSKNYIPREVLFGNPDKLQPRVSPDGKKLAFIAPHKKVLNVWLRTIGKDDEKVITNDDNRGIRNFIWAADNKHILYLQDEGGDENWRLFGVNIEDGEKIAGIGYLRKEVYGSISNPWHEDFRYRFSPNFSWRLFQHKTDTSLISSDIPDANDYNISFLALSASESIGYIQHIKHQENGYSIHMGLGVGVGLNASSPSYFSLGGGASYHRLFNPVVQWSTSLNTSYSNSGSCVSSRLRICPSLGMCSAPNKLCTLLFPFDFSIMR